MLCIYFSYDNHLYSQMSGSVNVSFFCCWQIPKNQSNQENQTERDTSEVSIVSTLVIPVTQTAVYTCSGINFPLQKQSNDSVTIKITAVQTSGIYIVFVCLCSSHLLPTTRSWDMQLGVSFPPSWDDDAIFHTLQNSRGQFMCTF